MRFYSIVNGLYLSEMQKGIQLRSRVERKESERKRENERMIVETVIK